MHERALAIGAARCGAAVSMVVAWILAAAPPAGAVDLLDGRLHVNGSIGEQIRGLSGNFEENLDLSQWYTVLGVEIDADLLPDGWCPFSSMSAFTRLEVRYDCVWTRACGLARSADTFGDRARKVPPRLSEARISGFTGSAFTGDRRRHMAIPIDLLGFA